MKMLIRIVLVLVVILLALILTRPDHFHIERSATIAAAPAVVFPKVDNLHQWASWSVWDSRDPNMQKTYDGPEGGVGGTYHWSGNKDVGEGRMTVTESQPSDKVVIKLDFIKPYSNTCMTTFTFTPEGAGTKVNWAMDGKEDFMGKAMSLFMNMDKMVGPDFESGLAKLKSLSEAEAAGGAASDSTAATQGATRGERLPG